MQQSKRFDKSIIKKAVSGIVGNVGRCLYLSINGGTKRSLLYKPPNPPGGGVKSSHREW